MENPNKNFAILSRSREVKRVGNRSITWWKKNPCYFFFMKKDFKSIKCLSFIKKVTLNSKRRKNDSNIRSVQQRNCEILNN